MECGGIGAWPGSPDTSAIGASVAATSVAVRPPADPVSPADTKASSRSSVEDERDP
jgi:hypothetical protein